MILARLTGGFGNQLFQYAFAKSTAKRLNTELVLDTSLLGKSDEDEQVVLRYFDLDLIKVEDRLASEKEVKKYNNISSSNTFDKLKLKANLKSGRVNWFIQKGHSLDHDQCAGVKDNTALVGRFQSEKFFKENKDLVKQNLNPSRIQVNEITKAVFDQNKNKKKVVMHVRRGDYVSHPIFSETIGALNPSYYEDALKKVKESINEGEELVVIVVSDDIDWCKENLAHLDVIFVEQERSKVGFASDFWLLTQANYSIISNSTFSWWGAWLAEAHGLSEMVLAPETWSREKEATPENVVPERWIKINNSFEALK